MPQTKLKEKERDSWQRIWLPVHRRGACCFSLIRRKRTNMLPWSSVLLCGWYHATTSSRIKTLGVSSWTMPVTASDPRGGSVYKGLHSCVYARTASLSGRARGAERIHSSQVCWGASPLLPPTAGFTGRPTALSCDAEGALGGDELAVDEGMELGSLTSSGRLVVCRRRPSRAFWTSECGGGGVGPVGLASWWP